MTSQKVKDLMLEAWEINGSFGTTDLFPFSEWDGGSNEEPMLTLNERWSVKAYLEVDEDDFVENCWFALVDWDENMEYYIEDLTMISDSEGCPALLFCYNDSEFMYFPIEEVSE